MKVFALRHERSAESLIGPTSTLHVETYHCAVTLAVSRRNYGKVSEIVLSRKEAVALVKIIAKTFPLDLLGDV